MALLRINHPRLLYAEGLMLTPVMVWLSAAVNTAAEHLIGWTSRTGPGIGWLFAASYMLCLAGALAMKKPFGHTVVLLLVPLAVIPLELLLLGALLLWLFGFPSGIQ